MAREASVKNLTKAKRAKNDKFYIQYKDIQKEIEVSGKIASSQKAAPHTP